VLEDKQNNVNEKLVEESKIADNVELVKEVLESMIDSIQLSRSNQKDSEI
jgi:hypothetical protein